MPQRDERFRLNKPTLAVIILEGQHHPTTVPSGAIIRVLDVPPEDNRLIDVKWEDKTVMMFTTDIRERGIKLEDV